MDAFTTEAFTLLGLGLSIIGLRLYARISTVGYKRLQADDYLMILAAIVYSIETALAYSVGAYWHGLANNAMTDEERRLLDPSSEEYRLRVNGSKTQVAGWSTYTLLLWVLKAAMCTFYLRLTEGLDYHKRIMAGFGIIIATWLAVLFSVLFGCYPLHKNWQIYPDPGNFCQPAISKIDIFVTVVLNVLTDLYLLSIPIPMLWQSSLRPIKKAGLMLLFSGGIFVTMAAILRCVLILTDPVNGAQQAGSWAVRETFVAVVTSNVPMIFPLVNRWLRPVIGTIRSYASQGGKSGLSRSGRSANPMPGAFRLEDKNPRRGLGPRSVNPITNLTFSESEERIYNQTSNASQNQNGTLPQHGRDGGSDTSAVDTEIGGHSPGTSANTGGILRETTLQVTESRQSRAGQPGGENFRDIGDYYLVEQARRSADAQRRPGIGHNNKANRSSSGFAGLGMR